MGFKVFLVSFVLFYYCYADSSNETSGSTPITNIKTTNLDGNLQLTTLDVFQPINDSTLNLSNVSNALNKEYVNSNNDSSDVKVNISITDTKLQENIGAKKDKNDVNLKVVIDGDIRGETVKKCQNYREPFKVITEENKEHFLTSVTTDSTNTESNNITTEGTTRRYQKDHRRYGQKRKTTEAPAYRRYNKYSNQHRNITNSESDTNNSATESCIYTINEQITSELISDKNTGKDDITTEQTTTTRKYGRHNRHHGKKNITTEYDYGTLVTKVPAYKNRNKYFDKLDNLNSSNNSNSESNISNSTLTNGTEKNSFYQKYHRSSRYRNPFRRNRNETSINSDSQSQNISTSTETAVITTATSKYQHINNDLSKNNSSISPTISNITTEHPVSSTTEKNSFYQKYHRNLRYRDPLRRSRNETSINSDSQSQNISTSTETTVITTATSKYQHINNDLSKNFSSISPNISNITTEPPVSSTPSRYHRFTFKHNNNRTQFHTKLNNKLNSNYTVTNNHDIEITTEIPPSTEEHNRHRSNSSHNQFNKNVTTRTTSTTSEYTTYSPIHENNTLATTKLHHLSYQNYRHGRNHHKHVQDTSRSNQQENKEGSSTINSVDYFVSTTVAAEVKLELTTTGINLNQNGTVSSVMRHSLHEKYGRYRKSNDNISMNLRGNLSSTETTPKFIEIHDKQTTNDTIILSQNDRNIHNEAENISKDEQIGTVSNDTMSKSISSENVNYGIVERPFLLEGNYNINDGKYLHRRIHMNPRFQSYIEDLTDAPIEESVTPKSNYHKRVHMRPSHEYLYSEETEVVKRNDTLSEEVVLNPSKKPHHIHMKPKTVSTDNDHGITLEMMDVTRSLEAIDLDESSAVNTRKSRENDDVYGSIKVNISEPVKKLSKLLGKSNHTNSEKVDGSDSLKDVSVTAISDSELNVMQDYIDKRVADDEVMITVESTTNSSENVEGTQTMPTNANTTETVTEIKFIGLTDVNTSDYENVSTINYLSTNGPDNQNYVNLLKEETTTAIVIKMDESNDSEVSYSQYSTDNKTSPDRMYEPLQEIASTTQSPTQNITSESVDEMPYEDDTGFTVDWNSMTETEAPPQENNENSNIMMLAIIKNETETRKENSSLLLTTILGHPTNVSILIQTEHNTNYVVLNVNAREDTTNLILNFTWPSTENRTNRITLKLKKKTDHYIIDTVQLYLVNEGNVSVWKTNVTQPHIIDKTGSLYLDLEYGVKIMFSNGDFLTFKENDTQIEDSSEKKEGTDFHVEIIVGSILFACVLLLLISIAWKIFLCKKKKQDVRL